MSRASILIITEEEQNSFYANLDIRCSEVFICPCLESVDIIENSSPEIVVLDCGHDVQRALRLLLIIRCEHPAKPVIFLSDQSSEELVLCAYKLGVREYIKKPFHINDLRNCIEKLLCIRNMIQEKRTPYSSAKYAHDTEDNSTFLPSSICSSICYIKENISDNISLSKLAGEANLSKYHFCRIFKSFVGKSPLKYIMEAKITKAKELLKHPDHNISFVAFEIGFNDLSSFVKHFKRIAGVTPSSYKKKIMQQHKIGYSTVNLHKENNKGPGQYNNIKH